MKDKIKIIKAISSIRTNLREFLRVYLILIFVGLISGFFLWYQKILPPKFKLGEKSSHDIVTISSQIIQDYEATEKLKEEQKQKAIIKFLETPKFKRDNSHNTESMERLKNNIEILENYFEKNSSNLNLNKSQKAFCANYSSYSKETWLKIKSLLLSSGKEILAIGYLGSIEENSLKYLNSFADLSDKEVSLTKKILENSLHKNIEIDLTEFENFRKNLINQVQPVYKTIPEKTVIIKKGQIIDYNKFNLLKQIDLEKDKNFNSKALKESVFLSLLFSLFFVLFLRLNKFRLTMRQSLLFSVIIISASVFVGIFAYDKPAFMPFAGITIINSLFFSNYIGVLSGILFAVLVSFGTDIPALLLIPPATGIVIGSMLSKKANNRAELAFGGIFLALTQAIIYMLIVGLSDKFHFIWSSSVLFNLKFPTSVLPHLVAGFGTAFIISNLMPVFESVFSVINKFNLKEFSDLEQPLLKKLREEAPGTYEHTLVVADFAQEAAKKINADHELVRVGVMYHDIGKLYNPVIFIENQFDSIESPHNKLSFIESARAIKKHVDYGVELAKKYKLPDIIKDFILSHQGTAQVGYFFKRAQEQDPSLKDDSQYRYSGIKPYSKETGIVMLADATEATIRSLKTTDKDLVKNTINKIIKIKVDDFQLVQSGLTREELEIISESFFESWKNKNHERLEY